MIYIYHISLYMYSIYMYILFVIFTVFTLSNAHSRDTLQGNPPFSIVLGRSLPSRSCGTSAPLNKPCAPWKVRRVNTRCNGWVTNRGRGPLMGDGGKNVVFFLVFCCVCFLFGWEKKVFKKRLFLGSGRKVVFS